LWLSGIVTENKMTLSEFVDKYKGKFVEVAGSPGALNQCVDLVNAYIRDVLGLQIIEHTNAKDFITKAGAKYDAFLNTPTAIPLAGDVIIWNKNVGGGAGHIGIFLEGDINSFKSFDQNWGNNKFSEIEEHGYKNVVGWLRAKPNIIPQPDENPVEKWLKGFFHQHGFGDKFHDYKDIITKWRDGWEKWGNHQAAIIVWENFKGDLQEAMGETTTKIEDLLVRAKELKTAEKNYINLKKYMDDLKDKVCISETEYERLKEKKILDRFTTSEILSEFFKRLFKRG
jgi:hypothetical protein